MMFHLISERFSRCKSTIAGLSLWVVFCLSVICGDSKADAGVIVSTFGNSSTELFSTSPLDTSWSYNPSTSILGINGANTTSTYLYGDFTIPSTIDITGNAGVALTGQLFTFPPIQAPTLFQVQFEKLGGTIVATADFSFADFIGGTTTVYKNFTTVSPSDLSQIQGFYIIGNGNQSGGALADFRLDLLEATTASTVPEPSSIVIAIAGLTAGGWSKWRRRKFKATTDAASRT